MHSDLIQPIVHGLSWVYMDPQDRERYRDDFLPVLYDQPEQERWAHLPLLLAGLPHDVLAHNRASEVARARIQRLLALMMFAPALVVLLIADLHLNNALGVIFSTSQAAQEALGMRAIEQIGVHGTLWQLAAAMLCVLMPLMWLHRPSRWTFAFHSILLVPVTLAVSNIPGLAIHTAAVTVGAALTVLTLWCIWTRPEDAVGHD